METAGYGPAARESVEAAEDVRRARTSRALELRAAELEELKRQGGGLLDVDELVERAGCCKRATVVRNAAKLQAKGEAVRAEGEGWHGKNGTWLFRPSAVEPLRELVADGKARRSVALAEGRAKGQPRMVEARNAELAAIKQERPGWLDADEVAEQVECADETVQCHACELGGVRVEGDGWHAAHGTWLFPPSAVERLREISAEGEANRAAAVEQARREGRTTRPRTRTWNGKIARAHWRFWDSAASNAERRDRKARLHDGWHQNTEPAPPSRRTIEALLTKVGRGRTRRIWKLRWAPKPGRRRTYTDDQAAWVLSLAAQGYGHERIAKTVGLHRDTVRRIRRAEKRA